MTDELTLRKDLVWERVGEEVVLVDLESNQVFEMSPTAARFWELVQGGSSITEAQAALLAEYEVDQEALEGELRALIDRLLEEGLATTDRS